jgi:hypothetical protein
MQNRAPPLIGAKSWNFKRRISGRRNEPGFFLGGRIKRLMGAEFDSAKQADTQIVDDRDSLVSPHSYERASPWHDENRWDPERASISSGISGLAGDSISDQLVDLFDIELEKNSENGMQRFLMRYTALIPLPFLMHHGVASESVISKPHVTAHVIPDFCYVTKHSIEARIVFIELKGPAMRWFGSDRPRVEQHRDLVAALAQIDETRRALRKREDEWLTLLRTLGIYVEAVEFRYVLIGGRSAEAHATSERRAHLRSVASGNGDLALMTYDSVRNSFRKLGGYFLNVLSSSKPGWRCADLVYPLFEPAPNEYLLLTSEQRQAFDLVSKSKPRRIGREERKRAFEFAMRKYSSRIAADSADQGKARESIPE